MNKRLFKKKIKPYTGMTLNVLKISLTSIHKTKDVTLTSCGRQVCVIIRKIMNSRADAVTQTK